VLLPLLRRRGERQIDLLMLSHRDSDHVGGAASLLAAMPVHAMSSSLTDDHPLVVRAVARGIPHHRCEVGQRWRWDGVDFEVLHPTAADHALAPPPRPNALSCVLRVAGTAGGTDVDAAAGPALRAAAGIRSVLLTGDIEAPQEAALLARRPKAIDASQALHADILLVPHHGSRTSSTPPFIEAVAPSSAVVQAAYRSRFGHPAPDIVARYESRGIAVWRSDRCGAFTLHPGGSQRCEREAARRYWHHRAAAAAPG
jgi:competence protein ComEC